VPATPQALGLLELATFEHLDFNLVLPQ
jgi:hypothetical protein